MRVICRENTIELTDVHIDRPFNKWTRPNLFRFATIEKEGYGNEDWFCIRRLPHGDLEFYIERHDIDGTYGDDELEIAPQDQENIERLLEEFLEAEGD